MNEMKLIALYSYICDCYDTDLRWLCQRYSRNNAVPDFTDVECLTVYLFGIIEEEKTKVKSIHSFARKYMKSWFPLLPSYSAFNHRINFLAPVFPHLIGMFLEDCDKKGVQVDISLIDSMPIITCSGKRQAKVARELTDKGYCATKKLHYFGVKLHAIAFRREGKLPFPEILGITPASVNDLNAVRYIFHKMENRAIFADKAYCDKHLEQELYLNHKTCLMTPVKLVKGEDQLLRNFNKAAEDLFSTAVSRVRQPIESFFNWLIEKTDIQRASKVRSENGLKVHVFGKVAAAVAIWLF